MSPHPQPRESPSESEQRDSPGQKGHMSYNVNLTSVCKAPAMSLTER